MAAIRDVTEARHVQRELRVANLRLEKASRAKDRFLASMSHELRTPLNAILGFTGTLLMELPGPLNDEQDKQLRIVQTSGRHLLSLINDLLDLARIESGKLEISPVEIDCRELLGEVALGLRPLANAKRIAIKIEAAPDVVVVSDRRALSQILINLTNNAIKFTEQGCVRLVLEQDHDPEGVRTRFTVIDTGIGIKPEDQETLFTAFEQIGGPAAHEYEGTGLGLHICQTLAPLLGGTISFRSEFGEGSAFTARAARGGGMSARVLVIEDNEENLTLVDYLLRAHGFDTLLARNGADGLKLATASKPDLILLDVRMPFMDGYEVARAIRADRALDPVPIVAVTASAMVGDRERIAQAGFDHYVQKPIDPERFIAEVERCLAAGSTVSRSRVAVTRVLVVDDRPNDRELMATVLGYAGYDVEAAGGGAEGLADRPRAADPTS